MATGICFFDMDGTLLRGETQWALLLSLLRQGLVPRVEALSVLWSYGRYLLGLNADAATLRASGYRLLRRIDPDRFDKECEAFANAFVARRMRRRAAELVEWHRGQGHELVLITASQERIARVLANRLRIPHVIGTRLEMCDGRLTGRAEQPEPHGEGKRLLAAKFRESVNSTGNVYAYSDNLSDLPLLLLATHPVAVNPSRRLKRVAVARNWPVLDLESGCCGTRGTHLCFGVKPT